MSHSDKYNLMHIKTEEHKPNDTQADYERKFQYSLNYIRYLIGPDSSTVSKPEKKDTEWPLYERRFEAMRNYSSSNDYGPIFKKRVVRECERAKSGIYISAMSKCDRCGKNLYEDNHFVYDLTESKKVI
ncbi:uncharacterized protein LOC119669161 [Teleopsis dalmanni]|uniref:uncharacterized protein LOC119669161 n=1 Tax=Teleopsis dalmanni TaxID=139649 RepID=UPI0018CCC453|nr:uncharacterized protein LOC119669161 [Teleopsis dalmanni]